MKQKSNAQSFETHFCYPIVTTKDIMYIYLTTKILK
ncbi:hypothetical protein HMPREF9447_03571 [Bacteroides oleiciplenus YIT 12058]|uniref:Uncharacterized protein n=1 Tax=Bacteroides oleiciplenus YIT 12058 TaxID=742727 RepID=K9E0U3_9BACE|nr:hypothetical protein HMPREF9447_03571 [Bacteroides oleiciplenus YIT 12058]